MSARSLASIPWHATLQSQQPRRRAARRHVTPSVAWWVLPPEAAIADCHAVGLTFPSEAAQ